VIVTGLQPAVTYHFSVFEYNGTAASSMYLLTGALNGSSSTAFTPAAGSTNLTGTASGLTLNLSWNSGPGQGRVIVMKEGSVVTGVPADLSKYPYSSIFGSGAQINSGEYVVYSGNGNNTSVTGLSGNKTYHFKIFEFNGSDAPVYNSSNAVSNSTIVPSVLPLQWLFFTAREENNKVELKWGVADEQHTSHFIIERSIGSANFSAIGTVQAAGSGSNEYTFIDNSLSSGSVSYRIKQVDIDGRFEYSKQVVVRTAANQGKLSIYPNPASGQARISLPQGMQQAAITIYSLEGRLIKTMKVVNGELLLLHQMPAGIYHVVIRETVQKISARLVLQ
jgi:hypothetical protein